MRRRVLALALALALAATPLTAIAAPGLGTPPPTVPGTKKAAKLDAINAPPAGAMALRAPMQPNARVQQRLKSRYEALRQQPYVPGQLIVKYKEGTTAAQAAGARSTIQGTKLRTLPGGAELIQIPMTTSPVAAAKTMGDCRRNPAVLYAEPNYIATAFDVIPTDSLFGNLWGLNNTGQYAGGQPGVTGIDIKAPLAWETTKGDQDLVIAVLDSGIDFSHPDLADRAWVNPGEIPGNGIDDDQNGYIDDVNGWDFYNHDNTVFDAGSESSHGTHVAGTIAASMDGAGVVGVAPNVKIVSLKFLGPNGTGPITGAVEAIEYARRMGFKIINNSWGGFGSATALRDAIASAYDSLFVAAAGNDGFNIDAPSFPKTYPAAYDLPNVLSVAAIDNQGQLAWYSNYGDTSVDVAAPGSSIFSTMPLLHSERGAAVANATATYKTVTLGVGLEDLSAAADRADLVSRVLTYFGATATTPITVILDDESAAGLVYPSVKSAYQAALTGLPNPVTYVTVDPAGSISASTLNPAHVVFWATGQGFGNNHPDKRTLTQTDLTQIEAYLNAGGRLFLSGQDALYKSAADPVVTGMLGVTWQSEGNTDQVVGGEPGTAFAGQSYPLVTVDPEEDFRDVIEPTAGVTTARRVLHWPASSEPQFDYKSGTSMATPHVAGVAALVKSVNPNMTPALIRERIMNTTRPLPSLAYMTVSGGLVDAARALAFSPDNDVPGIPFPRWGMELTGQLDGVTNTDMDDVYAIYLEAGQPVRAWLSGDAGTDYDLYLYGPGTPTVNDISYIEAWSENAGSAEWFDYVAPETGTYYIDVFAYLGAGEYTLRAEWGNGPGIYEDHDDRVKTTGTWYSMPSPGGSYKESRVAGPTMELSFFGNMVTVYGVKGPGMGMAAIGVNGALEQVDLYAPDWLYDVPVYTKVALPITDRPNVLTVKNLGQRGAGGRRTAVAVGIDRIDVMMDVTPPPQVPYIQAQALDGGAFLIWQYDLEAVPDFDYWMVNRAVGDGEFEPVLWLTPAQATQGAAPLSAGGSFDPSLSTYGFIDRPVSNGQDYRYIITAIDKNGNESEPSPIVSAHPDPAPAPVTELKAHNGDRHVRLTWAPGPEPDLSHYLVFRAIEPSRWMIEEIVMHDPTAQFVEHTVDGLSNEQDYTFGVIAVDVYDVQSDRATVDAHPSVPPPSLPEATAYTLASGVQLYWPTVSEPGVTYDIQRVVDGEVTGRWVTAETSYKDTGADVSRPNRYFIYTVDEWGVYGQPVEVNTWPLDPLTLTASAGQITVTWEPVPNVATYALFTGSGWGTSVDGTETSYTLSGLPNGVAVCVDMIAYGPGTVRGIAYAYQTVMDKCATPVEDTTPPPAPSNLQAMNFSNGVQLTWNRDVTTPDLDGYGVYRAIGSADPEWLADLPPDQPGPEADTVSWWDGAVQNETSYTYWVTAYDTTGNESPRSAPVSAHPSAGPGGPTVQARGADGMIYVTWSTYPEDDLDYFQIRVYDPTMQSSYDVDRVPYSPGVTEYEYQHTGLTNDVGAYRYEVWAVDVWGVSGGMGQAQATPSAPPAPPTELTATPGDGFVTLRFKASVSADRSLYLIWRSGDGGNTWSQADLIWDGGSQEYLTRRDYAVIPGKTYHYRVITRDRYGWESEPSAVAIVTMPGGEAPPDTTAPSVPTNVQASAGDRVVNLSWAASTDDVGVAGYTVYWGTGSREPTTWNEVPVTGTSWTHSGLTNGTTYWYKVDAWDGAWNPSGESVRQWAMPNAGAVVTEAGLYENGDPRIVYGPSPWSLASTTSASGGNLVYTNSAEASASLKFYGTDVQWIALKAPPYGISKVYIDGVEWPVTVDLYAGNYQYKSVVLDITGLTRGVHEIRVVRTANKNASATSYNINVDAFRVQ